VLKSGTPPSLNKQAIIKAYNIGIDSEIRLDTLTLCFDAFLQFPALSSNQNIPSFGLKRRERVKSNNANPRE
jgi:hypothetical protein